MFVRANTWLLPRYRLILVAVLMLATALRVIGVNNLSPPGLEHDEVAHWLINRDILSGDHALYFTEAYGHEAGFHYLQAGFMALLGDNAFTLRLPSAFAGLLLVAVTFALSRRLFDLTTAVLAASLLAALFWPVFYSRLALRAISLPLLSGLSAYFWLLGWQRAVSKEKLPEEAPSESSGFLALVHSFTTRPVSAFLLAGLLAGLSFYTYMAARAVPLFYGLFVLYLFLFHRADFKRTWRPVLWFFLAYTAIAAPLVLFLLNNPGAESRIAEVNQPLIALANGQLQPALENGLKVISMFGLRGDPLWRQNVAFLPVFEPLIAILFYIGLLVSLWQWRKISYLFLILWLITSSIPSIVTIDAPSSIRIINALAVITIVPVIGLQVIHTFRPLSTVFTGLSTKLGRFAVLLALLFIFLLYTGRTSRDIFQIWPAEDEVQFVWQQALTEAAGYLDDQDEAVAAAIGGWSPNDMDPATMALTLQREDLALRYFQPQESLIVPAAGDHEPVYILHPSALPLDPYLETILREWGAVNDTAGETSTLARLSGRPPVSPQFPAEVTFGSELTYLGYDRLSDCPGQADPCRLATYWRVEQPAAGRRRFFLHLVDEAGQLLTQDDRLGAPAGHWRTGDIIVQLHTLAPVDPDSVAALRLGLYDPDTGMRIPSGRGQDFLAIRLRFGDN